MHSNFTQDEKIEIFKNNLDNLLTNSGLSVQILFYLLKDYTSQLENGYEQYRQMLVDNINKKISEEEKSNSDIEVEE